jgi:CRP-like cAMP-binding protein
VISSDNGRLSEVIDVRYGSHLGPNSDIAQLPGWADAVEKGKNELTEIFPCAPVETGEDLVDQLFNSSEKRLARILLLLANFGKESRPEPVIAKISQETLAEMIGTTRSRVSFFMNKFRELGLIDYNGHIEVHSALLNVVLHDQPQIRR